MAERRRYSISELLSLRPQALRPTVRSTPLPIPRRPSPSPTRSPPTRSPPIRSPPTRSPPTRSPPTTRSSPPLRNGQNPFSSSPTGFSLLSHTFDHVDHTRTTRSTPSLPPGFGPPRNSCNSASSKPPTNAARDRPERRIARGPDISANFATRIAYANQHAIMKVLNQPSESSRIRPQRLQSNLHDLGLSSEIDRLFADDPSAETLDESKESQLAPRYMPRIESEASRSMDEQLQSKNEIQNISTKSLSRSNGSDKDMSFDDFARLVAAQTDQTKKGTDTDVQLEQFSEAATDDDKAGSVRMSENQLVQNTEKDNEITGQKDGDRETSVAALAKWFSSLAAAADVVEKKTNTIDEMRPLHRIDTTIKDDAPELVGGKSAMRQQVDKWMESVRSRALGDDVDAYFEKGLEKTPLSFGIEDIDMDDSTVECHDRTSSGPLVRTGEADLDKMMSHISCVV